MSCEHATSAALRDRGYRMTPQRQLIVSALRHSGGHRTAQELLRAVRQTYPSVDVSTVYRTMAALKEIRLVTETDLGQGESAFEWRDPRPHHHLVCERCGSSRALDHRYLERLGEALQQDLGFDADLDHFAIFGTCAECARAGARHEKPPDRGTA